MFSRRFIKLLALLVLVPALLSCERPVSTDDVEQSDANNQPQSESGLALDKRDRRGRRISHMLLGTGSVQGLYFPIGGVICRLVNRDKSQHRIRCSLESTGGSIYNLKQLREGNFDLVFAQSDWQYHAYNGSSTFREAGPNPELRSVFALEPDPLALMVKKDSDVNQFDDLQNRKVSFGYTRSLQHRIMNDFLSVKGWGLDSFESVTAMSDSKQLSRLCEGKLEAILMLSSALHDRLQNLPKDCEIRFIALQGKAVEQVIQEKPYYRTGKIFDDMFIDSRKTTLSFGLGATFVALESTSPKAIYWVVKEVVENFKDFQALHPSLRSLSKQDMPTAGISAPLHPGAERYYREARLLR